MNLNDTHGVPAAQRAPASDCPNCNDWYDPRPGMHCPQCKRDLTHGVTVAHQQVIQPADPDRTEGKTNG